MAAAVPKLATRAVIRPPNWSPSTTMMAAMHPKWSTCAIPMMFKIM
eukprot:CAMPEP_0115874010 /NCGR_PEP_ID=MMETSP0287-20121206/24308_1 /TAXON_ID=412157 /ORGANISM="Chrysochromulina rotalis, Strain UIO044" /LENGTH=45 /DNA_ID= /DNA_START= /DNA_END= /DNA_ORIENTATION=